MDISTPVIWKRKGGPWGLSNGVVCSSRRELTCGSVALDDVYIELHSEQGTIKLLLVRRAALLRASRVLPLKRSTLPDHRRRQSPHSEKVNSIPRTEHDHAADEPVQLDERTLFLSGRSRVVVTAEATAKKEQAGPEWTADWGWGFGASQDHSGPAQHLRRRKEYNRPRVAVT
jgi:hypothetical protein